MTRAGLFYDIISTIFERRFLQRLTSDSRSPENLCQELLTSKGEVSGYLLGQLILDKFATLDGDEIFDFFNFLTEELDVDTQAILQTASDYELLRNAENLAALTKAAESSRRELLSRINQVPGATEKLVHMREKLLVLAREHKNFLRTDLDFQHLFSSWFNRGFLVLKRIQWQSPASVLEKIIEYEAVHAIDDWDDLRRRVEPEDRRCYAFFHPSMPDDPLIFVQVALCRNAANSIQAILAGDREVLGQDAANTAVFYSISNCQNGLKGISFGNSLIKQVVQDLKAELPHLKTFITLSPIPKLRDWMGENLVGDQKHSGAIEAINDLIDDDNPQTFADHGEELRKLAAWYLHEAKAHDGQPYDPVARFHLNNGALIHDVHALADSSQKGLKQSGGVMVNYLYDLERLEQNHEDFASNYKLVVSKGIKNLVSQFANS